MNELQARRLMNTVMGRGIPKYMAKDIVETAMEASRGRNVDTYIDYAITLVYGLKFNVK